MTSERFKKFTILHSNDMHGDFLSEAQGENGNLIGGLALLSGYINQVRREERNVLFVIAGDMLQGSILDSDSQGVSTIEIMNYLAPDVVTVGNHELDYGLPHLLVLERIANFPLINANLYLKNQNKRLMRPHHILHMDGFDILFIGIITRDALGQIRMSEFDTFISVEDARAEVGKVCNAYKDEDIDLTVLLTHIGFEDDKELAAALNPEWGVDLIIGGHSHTILEQPAEVNGILVTQAGVGTDQIGRFNIVVDAETNSIVLWTWELVPIRGGLTEPDTMLQAFIDSRFAEVRNKYDTMLTHLARRLTHPGRDRETELGNLFADIMAGKAQVDVSFVISGSIRSAKLGPSVRLREFKQAFPYDTPVYKFIITGAQLRQIFRFNLSPAQRCRRILQVNADVRVVYDDAQGDVVALLIRGQSIADTAHYTISVQEYYYENAPERLGLSKDELTALGGKRTFTTSSQDVLEEYMHTHQNLHRRVEGRLVIHELRVKS